MANEQGFITNDREQTFLEVRIGGPGNAWKLLPADTSISAPSGGQSSVESDWGRHALGGSIYFGQRRTGNPAVMTANIMARMKTIQFMTGLLGNKNERWTDESTDAQQIDIRIRQRLGNPQAVNAFTELTNYYDIKNTSDSYDVGLADSATGVQEKISEQLALSMGFEYRQKPIQHISNASATVVEPQNAIMWVGGAKFFTGGDATATPAATYSFSTNNGAGWTFGEIGVATAGICTDVARSGNNLLFACPSDGVAFIDKDTFFAGGSLTFTLATGIATNFPGFIDVCPNGRVWAVGAGGRVWRSDDNGVTFTQAPFSAVTTTQAITSIHAVADDEVWCGLADGTCLRILGKDYPVASVVATGNADQVDAILAGLGGNKILLLGTDGGTIYVSTNRKVSAPTFASKPFPGSGVGTIKGLSWGSLYCESLYIVQNNASPVGRLIRDLSGGFLTNEQCEIANGGGFLPTNAGLNGLAMAFSKRGLSTGEGLLIGEEVSSAGYVGNIVSQ